MLTELDLLPPMPDASLLLDSPANLLALDPDRGRIGRNEDITLIDNTQLLSDDIEVGRKAPEEAPRLEDEALILDLGFGDELGDTGMDTSVHVGRDAPTPRTQDEEFGSDLKVQDDDMADLDQGAHTFAEDITGAMRPDHHRDDLAIEDADPMDVDINMEPGEPLEGVLAADGVAPTDAMEGRERDSTSPLSELRPSEERELEEHYQRLNETTTYEPEEEEEESVQQPRRTRRGKVIQPDAGTTLPSSQVKQWQQDRSRILKPTSFLPRDPVLLALMEMQQNGDFVSNVLGDGRGRGLAPELRGVLSLEVVRKSGKLKRKHDAEQTRAETAEEASPQSDKRPRLEFEDEDGGFVAGGDDSVPVPDTTGVTDGEILEIPAAADEMQQPDEEDIAMQPRSPEREQQQEQDEEEQQEQEERSSSLPHDAFDVTMAPLVHPADSGPVALGTQHAVHMLRDRFGAGAADSPSQRNKASVLFQDLLPENGTSKADATKMFFEVLVLATKDAVKVEQEPNALGGPIRIRGRRGLWGSWAEQEAAGEIAQQDDVPLALESAPVSA